MKSLFLFANGRVSALEKDLLPPRMWQMLLSARDVEEAGRLLADTWYGRFLQGGNFENCFEQAAQAIEQELMELSEDPALVRGILHRRDVRNARYIWKAALSGHPSPVETERPGLIPLDVLRSALTDSEPAPELPALMSRSLEEIRSLQELSPAAIDSVMDRLAAAMEMEELPGMYPGFASFLAARMDILNFGIAARCRLAGMDRTASEQLLLEGGTRKPAEIAQAASSGALPALISDTVELESLGSVLRDAIAEKSFLEYSRESERILLGMLDTGAFAVFGPAPLAAFVIKKEYEISHLRILLAAKAARLERSRLLRRLPRG